MPTRHALLALSAAICLLAPSAFAANSPRVFPEGQRPDDARLAPQKDLNGYFPFRVPALDVKGEL